MVSIDLSGQVAVVTGGAGELGRAICRTLSAAGASVAVNYMTSESKALMLVDEIRLRGGKAACFQADVTNFEGVEGLRRQIENEFGTATIVVNNAVVQYVWKTVLDQDLADYEGQFQSSVMQNVNMAKVFVPAMIAKGHGGRIIAINTECAMQNSPSQSAYVAGKRGMDGVLRVLAKEIGEHQITVNQVAPGWTESDKIRSDSDDPQKEYIQGVPLKRAGTDQDIANVVAFIASPLAAFITGAYIPVCGGNVMPTI